MRGFLVSGIVCLLLLVGCASQFDPATAYKDKSMAQIYDAGEKSLKTGYYRDAIQYYETLDARYPFGEYTQTADLHLIYAHYMNSDNVNALASAQRYIHLYPASPHVDYAYYMRALTNYELNVGELSRYFPIDYAERDLMDARKAFLAFSELTHRFPSSIYVPDAKLHMVYLRNLIALHELEVAKFYMKRKAYVAAVNRATIIVRHFQETPYVPQALLVMADAYHQLGLEQMSESAKMLYHYNRYDVQPT